jgi:hypothetical protein
MRLILELLRLDAEQHLSVQRIAASLGLPLQYGGRLSPALPRHRAAVAPAGRRG